MKKRIDRNASANTDSYYNTQQIVKALGSHASNQGLKYLIDKNQQATQLLQSGQNRLFIDEAAGILFREYCGTYLNKSVSSTSVDGATNSMYFTKSPIEYSTTTHDLELSFIQTPENRGKINAQHYVPVESDIIRLPVELRNEKISYNKDIVLLLGDTGVGKSTLLYYITGAEFEVKNANISGERTSILKSNCHFSRSKITRVAN